MVPLQLKLSIRSLWRNRLYTAICILGLTVGLTACLLIGLFVKNEFSYDRHFSRADDIYRIVGSYDNGGGVRTESALTPFRLTPLIEPVFPELERIVRLTITQNDIEVGERSYLESGLIFADEGFFELFDFEVLQGDAEAFSIDVNSVVITSSISEKYFAAESAVGKTITYLDIPYVVAAVIQDVPENTHFQGNIIFPKRSVEHLVAEIVKTNRTALSQFTYVLLRPGTNASEFADKISHEYGGDPSGRFYQNRPHFSLQKLTDIHLTSNLVNEIQPNGNILYVYLLSIVALIVAVLGYINYANLFVAASFERAREVGIKEVLGASRFSQALQFQCESVFVTLVSAVLGIPTLIFLTPFLNRLLEIDLVLPALSDLPFIAGLIVMMMAIGFFTGNLPARYLMKVGITDSLRGTVLQGPRNKFSLRNCLILFQFFIATGLVASVLIVVKQIEFLQEKDLGINTEQVVMVSIPTAEIQQNFELVREELLDTPGILNVTAVSNSLARRVGAWRNYELEGRSESVTLPTVIVAADFFETMGIELVAGRSFSEDVATDGDQSYVLNESAVRFLGLNEPIGSSLRGRALAGSTWSWKDARIIGVAKDFHMASLHSEIRPIAFSLVTENTTKPYLLVARIAPNSVNSALEDIENLFVSLAPESRFNYQFLDAAVQEHYDGERQVLRIFSLFAVLSIVIGCLGLFGLTAFMMRRRTKETGIRKVLGADVWNLLVLLSRDFLLLVLMAGLISVPVTYIVVNQWLSNFAYRIDISVGPFIYATGAALLIAFLSIVYHSILTARTNPVESLQYE